VRAEEKKKRGQYEPKKDELTFAYAEALFGLEVGGWLILLLFGVEWYPQQHVCVCVLVGGCDIVSTLLWLCFAVLCCVVLFVINCAMNAFVLPYAKN